MTVNVKGISKTSQIEAQPLLIDLEEGNQKKTTNFKSRRKGFTPKNKSSSQPIFIRYFVKGLLNMGLLIHLLKKKKIK